MSIESNGRNISNQMYAYKKYGEEIEKRKKNGIAINLKICKSDLEIIDFLAREFNVSRNWIISTLVENDTEEMLSVFGVKPRYELAVKADAEMSKRNLSHDYLNKTWEWGELTPDLEVFNPTNKGLEG